MTNSTGTQLSNTNSSTSQGSTAQEMAQSTPSTEANGKIQVPDARIFPIPGRIRLPFMSTGGKRPRPPPKEVSEGEEVSDESQDEESPDEGDDEGDEEGGDGQEGGQEDEIGDGESDSEEEENKGKKGSEKK